MAITTDPYDKQVPTLGSSTEKESKENHRARSLLGVRLFGTFYPKFTRDFIGTVVQVGAHDIHLKICKIQSLMSYCDDK